MRFYPVINGQAEPQGLAEEYAASREIGVVRVGSTHLFFRARFKHWYIPYADITRCFRRVFLVPARMCCGKGDFRVENLIVMKGDDPLAQIQLPGTRAAQALIADLKEKMPHADFTAIAAAPAEGEASVPS